MPVVAILMQQIHTNALKNHLASHLVNPVHSQLASPLHIRLRSHPAIHRSNPRHNHRLNPAVSHLANHLVNPVHSHLISHLFNHLYSHLASHPFFPAAHHSHHLNIPVCHLVNPHNPAIHQASHPAHCRLAYHRFNRRHILYISQAASPVVSHLVTLRIIFPGSHLFSLLHSHLVNLLHNYPLVLLTNHLVNRRPDPPLLSVLDQALGLHLGLARIQLVTQAIARQLTPASPHPFSSRMLLVFQSFPVNIHLLRHHQYPQDFLAQLLVVYRHSFQVKNHLLRPHISHHRHPLGFLAQLLVDDPHSLQVNKYLLSPVDLLVRFRALRLRPRAVDLGLV